MWRRWRRLPQPSQDWRPEGREAFLTACALYAGQQERIIADIAESFAKKQDGAGGWQK